MNRQEWDAYIDGMLEKAREWLRLDNEDNDEIILGLLNSCPAYIEATTGVPIDEQMRLPLIEAVTRFLLQLWYNAEQSEAERLQRVIDNLLKSITVLGRWNMPH